MTEQRLAKQAAEREAARPQRDRPSVPSDAWNPRRRDDSRDSTHGPPGGHSCRSA